jgi:hypothetical protein
MEKVTYLTTTPNQNLINYEIKSRLNSGNACYHSFRSFFLSACRLKILRLIHIEVQFCLQFYTGVKLGLSHISKISTEFHQVHQCCVNNKTGPIHFSTNVDHYRKATKTSNEFLHVCYVHLLHCKG